jgi:LmbE family N-acetylglucosaminyl deacetylase
MRALLAKICLRRLPIALNVETIIRGQTPLVLAPHPDDESLGCGGFIAACVAIGRPPVVVFLTDGSASHPNSRAFPPSRLQAIREDEARAALKILGLDVNRAVFMRERDSDAPMSGPAFEAAAKRLGDLCTHYEVGVIVAPWEHDPSPDHIAAHLLAQAISTRLNISSLAYPVWGWFLPKMKKLRNTRISGWRLNISEHLEAKRRAIAAHCSQHGGLIYDDESGFALREDFLSVFYTNHETFIIVRP